MAELRACEALNRRRRSHRAAGFSMVEVLIAAVLLLVMVLALVPLFGLSLSNNLAGREYSVASQHGRSQVERIYPLPLDHPSLAVPVGAAESEVVESLDPDSGEFTTDAVVGARWRRQTTIRQYNVRDLYQSGYLETPLDGGSAPNHVHLREVVVEVENEREAGAGLGEGREVAISTVRGF